MGLLVRASDGEIVEIGTGIVQGFKPFYLPRLTTDVYTLLRHWDGMSAEPLGSIPKIITLSREEQRLLSRLQPWKFLKYAIKQDYMRLIDKINKQRFSTYLSIYMKNQWANPNSVYNSPVFRARQSAVRMGVPHDVWPIRRARYGPSGVKDPVKNSAAQSKAAKRRNPGAWVTRRRLYGPSGVKDPTKHSDTMKKAVKKAHKTRIERYGPTGRRPKVG